MEFAVLAHILLDALAKPIHTGRAAILRHPAFQAACHEPSFHLLPHHYLCNHPKRSFLL